MRAWLRRIDLDSYAVERVALAQGPARQALDPNVALVSDGGHWRLDASSAPRGARVNGAHVARHTLTHGDLLSLPGEAVVFLEAPEAHDAELDARLATRPGDPEALRVWADWLLEHGDPLGGHLQGTSPSPFVLEGLAPLIERGQLELRWRHGMIDEATFRCTAEGWWTDPLPLLRLASLRVARWTRRLTIDLAAWTDESPGRLEHQAAVALRALLTGPHLAQLEALTLFQPAPGPKASVLAGQLLSRLAARFPRLPADGRCLASADDGALRITSVPAGLDFMAPSGDGERIPLSRGLWVGSSGAGSLRAMSPGQARQGLINTFLVDEAPPRWRLAPLEPGVLLNGRRAVATRLLPGDLIEEPRGTRFTFDAS